MYDILSWLMLIGGFVVVVIGMGMKGKAWQDWVDREKAKKDGK